MNLPFSRGAIVVTEGIRIPPGAEDSTMEKLRQDVENALNEATKRAYAIVDGKEDGARG
jgi:lysophospholipid acyltransferase (LPLAT)-like uncharacterized protein